MTTEEIRPIISVFIILTAVGLFSLTAAYYFGNSLCPVYNFVGIPCPSCGMTRAWSFALRGRLGEAFTYHPMFWIVIFLPFLAVKNRRISIAAIIILAVFICVWAARMIFCFPYKDPMTFNRDALIFKIFEL